MGGRDRGCGARPEPHAGNAGLRTIPRKDCGCDAMGWRCVVDRRCFGDWLCSWRCRRSSCRSAYRQALHETLAATWEMGHQPASCKLFALWNSSTKSSITKFISSSHVGRLDLQLMRMRNGQVWQTARQGTLTTDCGPAAARPRKMVGMSYPPAAICQIAAAKNTPFSRDLTGRGSPPAINRPDQSP